jgi:hypothetical protein
MADPKELAGRYIDTWNETDPARRRELVARTFTEDASYVDPLMSGEGTAEIDAMIAGAQQQYPGHRFALLDSVDAHHDRVRFSWTIAPDGGEPIAVGTDFAVLADDGRLCAVTGFLQQPS